MKDGVLRWPAGKNKLQRLSERGEISELSQALRKLLPGSCFIARELLPSF